MQAGTIGRRYARALVLAMEGAKADALARVEEQLSALAALLDKKNSAAHAISLRIALFSPAFGTDERRQVVDAIAKAHDFEEITRTFLGLLIEKDRLRQLPAIARAFRGEVDDKLGQVRAVIAVPSRMGAAEVASVVAALEKRIAKKVIADIQPDDKVIAGVRAQVGGVVYDATIQAQLTRIAEQLAL